MDDLPTPHATTRHVGPLGSTIHVLRADAGTVAELAAIAWSRHFRRVCLDPVRGLITLMAPSRLHEELAGTFDHVVDYAASGGELVAAPELSDENRERVAELLQMIAATHEFQRA